MKKIIFIIIVFLFLECKDPVETKCDNACKFFVKCTEEINNIKITGQDLNLGIINCMKGCTRYQTEILGCYAEEPDSCTGMAECMIQSGLGD